jgi:HEPN domain-containing protein
LTTTRLLNRLNELISRGEEMRRTFDFPVIKLLLDRHELSLDSRETLDQWKLSCLNIVEVLVGRKSVFFETFLHKRIDYYETSFGEAMSHYLSVLKALKEEFQTGFLQGIEILVTRDMLDTIVEEAKVLLQAKYKDAAAIYCRVIIETSAKKLCDKNKLSYRKKEKLSAIIDKLKKKGVLSLPEWRQIQAWMDIGNSAAHGKFDEYSAEDVKNMLNGIDSFIETKLK